MRLPLVAGNWKLHGTRKSVAELASAIATGTRDLSIDTLICPAFLHLQGVLAVLEQTSGARVSLGAQNCSDQHEGAFTGEVSARMLAEAGATHVIVGHSERRQLYAENDHQVAARFEQALAAGLTPILCVGETAAERESSLTEAVVGRQLQVVIERCGIAAMASSVLAYEPVWAIGTGLTATPAQAQAVHGELRSLLAVNDSDTAAGMRILYGGSVKPDNAVELFSQQDIDGGLIGGASLKADAFIAICQAAAKSC